MKKSTYAILGMAAILSACGGGSGGGNKSSSSAASSLPTASSEAASSQAMSSELVSSSVASSEAPVASAWQCPATGLYFCDDFAALNSDKWDLLPTTNNSLVPDGVFDLVDDSGNGILRYIAASSGGVLALVKPSAFTGVTSADYYVEAKIRPRANGTTSNKQLYILARYQDGNNWYAGALNVQNATTSTQVEITKMLDGSLSRPKQVKKPIAQGTLGMLDGQWYSLRLELLGNQLTVYLDGESIATLTDESFTSQGLIGFWTANKSFEIDDVKVGNANEKPASLLISPSNSSYTAEVGDAPRVISVTSKTDAGSDDSFTAISSNPEVLAVSISGTEVSLTPVGAGTATVTFSSGSGLLRSISAEVGPQFVMPTATYNLSGLTLPAVAEVDTYEDTQLKLTFDSAPTLGATGAVRIFKLADDSVVDTIKASDESDAIGFGTLRSLKTRPIRINGNSVSISLHANKLQPNTSYYVAVSSDLFTGATLAGSAFEGIGKNADWHFTTRAAVPAAGLSSITVDDTGTSAHFRTVQGALNYAMQHVALADPVTIEIKNGSYEEPLYLRNKNNVTLKGESREGVVIQYPNNELLNSGSTGRALFLVEAADMLTLDSLTLKNTTLIGAGGQAETIYFNSTNGRLVAINSNFISEQDTLLLKGWTWFYDSLVAGNVDFIWGYSKASLFEKSEIRTLGRSSKNENGGYVLQARVEAETDKGFVFLNSSLTSGAGPTGDLPIDGSHYLARSGGDPKLFDNIVFVNTKMGSHIAAGGFAGGGVNSQPNANPATGTATAGWREYASMDLSGNPLDVSARQFSQQLTLADVQNSFCSRAQIFAGFNSGAGWNPLPSDNSDCINPAGSATSSSAGSSSSAASSSSMGSSSSASSTVTTSFTPVYAGFEAAVASDPAAGSNANFIGNAAPYSIGGINYYSPSDGRLRLHNSGTAYAINFNGSSLPDEPKTLVEGTSGQVDPKILNANGGVSRYVSVPYAATSNPVTLSVTYSNSSSSCVNGQIAILDQHGKTWKVASACGSEQSVISVTVTDPTVTELFILNTRSGDSGGGIRIWNIDLSK